ncbi:hypothetical protein [Pontibacillus yanchengensis]|uniref:Uncharacterized protein n=1 Tax=Pontibacillus yanchengensis Y32 TaxID=1385514 RepID=A0A0A2TSZ9_9BACI|nr:hypothetical protein [Pontibacillus yanchengensis]KGP72355.1 hypothetical protein N782_12910 [Pontibacillus yanchengensis Y32]
MTNQFDSVYRPVVRDGLMNTNIGSPNAYADAAEAVMEAMHFAHVYNDDMYDGEISWEDAEIMTLTREQLRILSGTINRPNAQPFYIDIEAIDHNSNLNILERSKAKDEFRVQNNEIAIKFKEIIETNTKKSDSL